jgi:hypothetical protein
LSRSTVGGAHVDERRVARLIEAATQAIAASWREVAVLLAKPDAVRL